jgi:hypothetical protein
LNEPRLTLLSREGCGLCEEFAAELATELATLGAQRSLPPLEIADVDSDPEWQRRYGLKIPVLLWDGEPVLTTFFDAAELQRLFRVR